MPKRSLWIAVPVLLLLPLLRGGWAVVTLTELPDYLTAGKAVTLGFTIRQHGVTPLSGLKPLIEAHSGGLATRAAATPGKDQGQYVATLTLPAAGTWTITIKSGFGTSELTLLPLQAIAAADSPIGLDETERGRRLFVGKGCVTCHINSGLERGNAPASGPELTGRHYPHEYLQQFLLNPAIAKRPQGSPATMPNLQLKQKELAALVAFINADRQGR